MSVRACIRTTTAGLFAGIGIAAGSYAALVAITWIGFGRLRRLRRKYQRDPLLERFVPDYDVVERHSILVNAPPEITLTAACDHELRNSVLIDAIFRVREGVMGSKPDELLRPGGLLAQMTALGWGRLAEVRGREIVMGAICRPWMADVVFEALPADEFADFWEPGYVKIVWTLRADPVGHGESVFRTETRAVATDAAARAKFRWYWAKISPGVWLVRQLLLRPLKKEAERRSALLAIPGQPVNDSPEAF